VLFDFAISYLASSARRSGAVSAPMSSRVKIPNELEDPALLFEGNRVRVIEKCQAEAMCDMSSGKKTSARRCVSQKVRSNRWPGTIELNAYRATNFGNADVPPRRGLSSRMSPRHPRANGDFRRGAYHDLLDAGGNPTALADWGKKENRHYNGPRCEKCKWPSDGYKNGKSLCRACAEQAEPDPELIRILRNFSEEPVNDLVS
jgi:hypothetical protein